jgi:hypothetical protein
VTMTRERPQEQQPPSFVQWGACPTGRPLSSPGLSPGARQVRGGSRLASNSPSNSRPQHGRALQNLHFRLPSQSNQLLRQRSPLITGDGCDA